MVKYLISKTISETGYFPLIGNKNGYLGKPKKMRLFLLQSSTFTRPFWLRLITIRRQVFLESVRPLAGVPTVHVFAFHGSMFQIAQERTSLKQSI